MKKIGFIDFYLSEWHANNYPAWIAEANAALPESDRCEVAYAWAEERISPVDGLTSEQWCEKFGAVLCGSIEEVCEKSDYILILAPSNPEKHLAYAEKALPFGKNTYIDKTFAPDYATAKRFSTSPKNTGRSSSTSALRLPTRLKRNRHNARFHRRRQQFRRVYYSPDRNGDCDYRARRGLCSRRRRSGPRKDKCGFGVKIHYPDNRSATLIYAPPLGFSFSNDKTETVVSSDFFRNLIAEILNSTQAENFRSTPPRRSKSRVSARSRSNVKTKSQAKTPTANGLRFGIKTQKSDYRIVKFPTRGAKTLYTILRTPVPPCHCERSAAISEGKTELPYTVIYLFRGDFSTALGLSSHSGRNDIITGAGERGTPLLVG
ncbi:MAG: hypothetical protein ACLUSP_10380 [Christensenellales bacterium]